MGQIGLGALSLPELLSADRTSAASPRPAGVGRPGKAKSCILIYLWGGPPQMDLWDPNPHAPVGIRSLFKPVATAVPGIHIAEEMPQFAKVTGKTAIIRSLSHDSNIHENSVYRTLTGRIDKSLVMPRNRRKRSDAPTIGSVVSYFQAMGDMPSTVTIPRPIGHDGVTYCGTYAGFLGPRHDPMEVQPAGETDDKAAHPVALPEELSRTRLLARRGLLDTIEQLDRRLETNSRRASLDAYRAQAFSMLTSPKAKQALDLEREDPKTRDRYGRNEWGESILTARRLIEAGVRLVTISWMYIQKSGNVANVWDNHGNFEGKTGYQMLKAEYCLPSLDRGFAALMEDLSVRGLLDETLIAMYGEFGRTPKINNTGGRDHWGACQSAVLAGGGIRGGQVYGASDRDAAYPKANPVSPEDLLATIYYGLGIAAESEMFDQLHRPHRVVEGTPLACLFG
jgi:hypothetical protein